MKKLLIALLAVAGLPATLRAQEKTEEETITAFNGAKIYPKEERSAAMKVIAQALLFNLECSTGDAFRVGLGLEGDYFAPKFVSAHAEYVTTYFNLQKLSAKTLNLDNNTIHGFSLFEAGGRLHFVDKKGRARHKLVLGGKSEYHGSYTLVTEHYLKAKFPCRRIWAARGGFYHTSAPVTTDMNKDELPAGEYGAVKTKDGAVLSNAYYTNAYTTGFYLGLSSIINMSVHCTTNVSAYSGSRYFVSFFRETFADVLIATTTFDPFIVGSKVHEIEPNAPGSFQTSDIGWRVGKKVSITRKTLNMGASFELGMRPGVKGRGAYFGTGLTLAFAK